MTHIITLHKTNIARCGDVEVKTSWRSGPIGPLARKLLNEGLARPFDSVEVYRDGTLCFYARDLIHWASIHTTESESRSVTTKVYKPRPDLEAAQ